jgi:hormone-sensitive lipase
MKNYIYYKANENKAKIDFRKFQIKTNFDNFPNFMKLFKSFKSIFSKFLPSVEFRRKIYVLKEQPQINRSYIEKLINFMKGEDIPVDSNNNIIYNLKEELPLLYKDKIMDKSIKRNYVSVTILNNKKLYFKDEQEEGFFSSLFNKFKSSTIITQVKNEFKKNTILIAVHGGGFIGSSTFLHERYLRKWVKELDIPIFGINYSLAPKYKYPEGVNDVFQAYMWILNHAKEELNMDIKHIILYGDSAGANIILSLNSLLIVLKEYDKNISKNIILPELLLPFYPVTHVSIQSYSNSLLLTLGQQMLSPDVLKYMCNQYLGEYLYQDNDMFLNPIKLNDFILDRMNNKIRIFFGSSDILRDDSIRLLHVFSRYNNKNGKNKIDVRGYDIFGLGHGFNGQRENVQKISRDLLVPEIVEYLRNIF